MKNRIALVTGGMGDIGTAICHEFCERGAKVIAADRLDKDKAHVSSRTRSLKNHRKYTRRSFSKTRRNCVVNCFFSIRTKCVYDGL